MSAIIAGPIFFAVAMGLVALGVVLLAFLFRQAWAFLGAGFFCVGLAVPGWLTAVGILMALFSVAILLLWTHNKVGRSL